MIITASGSERGALRRRRESRRLWRAEVFYALGLAAFAGVAVLAHAYAYFAWDLSLARAIQSFDSPAWAAFMDWVSVFGNHWTPHALPAARALVCLAGGRRSEAFGLILSTGGGSLLSHTFKALVARPRPATE